jgi:hypothetical protein
MRGLIVPVSLLLLAAVPGASRPAGGTALPCTVGGPPISFSIARTQNIVGESRVIARATALGEVAPPAEDPRQDATFVAFSVDEVLRGRGVPDTLRLYGVIREDDAWPQEEETEIPHRSYLRRSGGTCMAFTYQTGGEYLLLLNPSEHGVRLDPYWMLLAPTNNQIHGADDWWLQWVRLEIARNPPRP